ncbi:SDR family NAD(P)-dependent oxidoreductase [Pseudomonas abietaniphila]|uniref:SDR family NAD(P)-dependent oxidoreductase n=1 Tax=Pseudomonas abietaniphila TaxID=89065 RepID=UPI003216EEC8
MFKHRGTAVITGVSSGRSQAYARRMAAQGYDLILIAPDLERLQTLARRITDASGQSVEVIAGDLSIAQDRQHIAQVLSHDASITLLVNYATPLSCSSGLCGALKPGFMARRRGAVVEVTGKAECPTEDAAWTEELLEMHSTGSRH